MPGQPQELSGQSADPQTSAVMTLLGLTESGIALPRTSTPQEELPKSRELLVKHPGRDLSRRMPYHILILQASLS